MANKVHISGADIDIALGGLLVNIDEFSISIEDGMKATRTRGVPNGHVGGEVGATGEIKLDTENFNLVMSAANSAGSFQGLEPFDVIGQGETVSQSFKVSAFGCKLTISDLMSVDSTGGEKQMHTLPFEVTDKRFVEINGVPYLSGDRTESILL